MNRLAFVFVTLFSTNTFAMRLYCNPANGPCAARISMALSSLGCEPDITTLACQPSSADFELEYCEVATAKCMEPSPDLMITTHCNAGSKRDLKLVDAGLSLTWWMGWGPYVTEICRF